jgi:Domain of unknown function (DUF4276)
VKFVLFVEGHTEKRAIPSLLKRWLDPQLTRRVGVDAVRFEGWAHYQSEIAKKVRLKLSGPGGNDVIAAIGLLDLYGPTFYPPDKQSASDRVKWAKKYFEAEVGDERFSQHFAVHEIEAWLLADPRNFPRDLCDALPGKIKKPETVNFNEPPGKLLARLYREKLKKTYGKVIDGSDLFGKLDPAVAYEKCPSFKAMLDDMLARAKRSDQ